MPIVPAAYLDGAKTRQLIRERGYVSIAQFASTRRRLKVKTIYCLIHGTQRGSLELIEEIAEVLGVEPAELIREDVAALETPRPAAGTAGQERDYLL